MNEVRLLEHPKTVPAEIAKWIDIDLGEQVLVTYENDKPTYATLVSSGRAFPTPMGTYPVGQTVCVRMRMTVNRGTSSGAASLKSNRAASSNVSTRTSSRPPSRPHSR